MVLATACDRSGPELEVRTFKIEHVGTEQAAKLVEPYVFRDRPESPGAIATGLGAITVRETADNLARIDRLLAEFDVASTAASPLRIEFQLIGANGSAETDPRIADVATELEKLFRFDGYSLVGETFAVVSPGNFFDASFPPLDDQNRGFRIAGSYGDKLDLGLSVHGSSAALLSARLSVPPGRVQVFGSFTSPIDQMTVILVVRVIDA